MPTPLRQSSLFKIESKYDRLALLLTAAVILAAAIILYLQGRVWWCTEGDSAPWSWNIWSPHNSQHLIDPYSFTHVLHGILEFWLIGLFLGRLPLAWRLLIALSIESTWEILENSTYVIQRYRDATISLNYFGDSIINSISDIVCCGLGFVLGWKLRFWRSLALFVITEVTLIVWIHDSFLINILMLIWPVDSIRHWQMGR